MKDQVFISLDVVNLHPRIPIIEGIKYNLITLRKYWNELDNFGVSIEYVEKLLHFVCYNYEIKYENKFYKQVLGVPMGAHFAPPFSIIFMHHIESEAIKRLDFKPLIFRRYADDIICGPLEYDTNVFNEVLKTFNSVIPEIQFTLEYHPPSEWLPFLDLKVIKS